MKNWRLRRRRRKTKDENEDERRKRRRKTKDKTASKKNSKKEELIFKTNVRAKRALRSRRLPLPCNTAGRLVGPFGSVLPWSYPNHRENPINYRKCPNFDERTNERTNKRTNERKNAGNFQTSDWQMFSLTNDFFIKTDDTTNETKMQMSLRKQT